MELAAIVRDYTVAAAAAGTAWVAIRGLSEWRRQMIGHKQYDVSLDLLRAAFKLRDAIAHVRAPFVSTGEQAAAIEEVGLSEEGVTPTDPKAAAAVYEVRWRPVADALRGLDLARVEGEILWGSEIIEPVREVRKFATELNAALHTYLSLREQNEINERINRTVFFRGEEDEFAPKLEDAISSLESVVRPKMQPK